MMKMKLLLFAVVMLCSFTIVILQDWEISAGFTIHFDGRYAQGSFEKLAGSIRFDPENPENAKFDVTVDVTSIETGNDLKNKHAQSEKWFDAARFPSIRFTSSDVIKRDSGYVVRGDLEVRGIKKMVEIPFVFKKDSPAFLGKFKVNRGDFGIGKSTGKSSDSTTIEVMVPVLAKY